MKTQFCKCLFMPLWTCFCFLVLVFGCNKEQPPAKKWETQQIAGRTSAHPLLYRIKTPPLWIRKDPDPADSLEDTTKPIAEFLIREGNETIRITIHNFPSASMESRIPPNAQIARWKKQFDVPDFASLSVITQSFSGYVGLMMEGSGMIDGAPTTMLGWSLQLAPEHYNTLSHPAYDTQKRADATIKAVGPKQLMSKYRSEIIAAARSFELIDEIPTQLFSF